MPIKELPEGCAIRDYKASDTGYLVNTFLHSAHNLALFQGCPNRLYHPPMRRLFEQFTTHPKARIAVVCDKDDPDWIVSWLAAWILKDVSVVWYAHTRSRWRRKGICDHLVATMPGSQKAAVFTSRVWTRINRKHKLISYPTLILEVPNHAETRS